MNDVPLVNAPEAVFILNRDGVIRFATPAAAAYYGYRVEDVIGRSALRFVVPEYHDQAHTLWLKLCDTPAPAFVEMNLVVLTAHNHQHRPARISAWRLPDSHDFLVVHHVLDTIRDRLKALYAVLTAMSSTLDLDQVLDILLCETQRLIPAPTGTIFILQPDGRLELMRAYGCSLDDYSPELLDSLADLPTIRMLRETGKPLIIRDCATDPRWFVDPKFPVGSWLGAPLTYHGEFLGMLNLDNPQPNAFTEEDAELAQALANQAAIALHTARQFRAEQRRAERYAAINEVITAISQLDLRSLLDVVYRKISAFTDTSSFFIGLHDAEAGIVHLVGSYDHGLPRRDEVQADSVGLTSRVLRTRESVIIMDSEVETFPEGTLVDDEVPRSLIMMPLIVQDEVVGVISVQSYRPYAYSPDDITMLETIAGATATAIRNAQLYDQTAARLAVLQGLQQLSIRFGTVEDPAVVAEITVRAALDLFQSDEVRLFLCEDPACLWIGQLGEQAVQRVDGPLPDVLLPYLDPDGSSLIAHHRADQPPEIASLWQAAACALFPLSHGDRRYGLLALLYHEPHFFRRDTLRALELLCSRATIAVENALYTITLRRRLTEVSALQELARQVSASQSLAAILDTVVHTLHDAYRCRSVSLALVDHAEGMVITRAAAGLAPEYFEAARFPLGEFVAGQVAATGQPIYVADTTLEPEFRFIDPDIRSMLTIPLTVQDRVIGTLGIDSGTPNAFTPDHERVLTIAGGQIAAAIEMVRLLDETRERAAQLARANAELAAMDELRTELLQDVSHELRSPLSLVRGYAALLKDNELGELTPEQADAVAVIDERAEAITRLVSDLLSTEQITTRTLNLIEVDVNRWVEDVVSGARLVYAERPITLEAELVDETVLIRGDRSRLNQVLDNLIGNAVKFSPDGGVIATRITSASGVVQVSVSDQGIGIPAERLPHIFERFFQGDRSIKRQFGGSGLGLYIVHQIIEAHGGKVWVESEEGKGSTFTIELSVIER